MNFTALQNRVAEETGLDLANTDDITSIKAWINQVYLHVSGVQNWDWLFKQGTIQTLPDITTGTATVTAYSSTVTLSSAPTAYGSNISVAGQWMINFPSVTDDWYFISAHTSSSVSLTMANTFKSSSNLTAGSYILRRVLYSLPTDCDRVIDIRQQVSSGKLHYVDPRTFDRVIPNPTATGTPRFYSLMGRFTNSTPTNVWQIGLYPTPDVILNLQVKYYQVVTDLVSTTDIPLLPTAFHDVLVWGALMFYGHPYIDDDRMSAAKIRYDKTMQDMKANSKHVPDGLTRLQRFDMWRKIRPYSLPDEYEV